MTSYKKDISVIIPQRNSIETLPRLFASIPEDERIEIIVVDNTPMPITKEQIGINRDYKLAWSAPERHAGGARNVGIENANGEWLLFADADDYYSEGAFDVFLSRIHSDAEIVYTGMEGIYLDTGETSDRGDCYTNLVKGYLNGTCTESDLRFGFASPCCKMVRRSLIDRHSLRFDEIRAGNDIYFSLTSGYYAQKVEAVDFVSYIATVSKGSLTKRRDYEVIKSRLYSKLHCNQFLKQHGYSERQHSVMFAIAESRHFGMKSFFEFVGMIRKFGQNPFIGYRNWSSTFRRKINNDKKDARYLVR